MTTQQLERTTVGGRRIHGGWLIGFALVALATLLMAGWLAWPALGSAWRLCHNRSWAARSR